MNFHSKLSIILPKLPSEELPRGYQILGNILIIRLKSNLYKHRKSIGRAVLKLLPYVHIVVLEKGLEGETRKPKIEIIAGCNDSTQTIVKEHGCKFLMDVSKVMWSKGNKHERQRVANLVKPSETIVDMFAGIGYFSIFLAKKVKKVYSIDINPKAVEYLQKNVWLNGVENRIKILQGDNRKFVNLLKRTADRVVMGYLDQTERFLPYALKMAKKGAVIHFHRAVAEKEEGKLMRLFEKHNLKLIRKVRVKSYAPKVWHTVFDLRVL